MDFNEMMKKDLQAAYSGRQVSADRVSGVALGQIADALIQLRWIMEDMRATMRQVAMKK